MYMLEDMVDLGLPDGVMWPTEFHRKAAQALLLNNPEIHTRDALNTGVSNILNIPDHKIKSIKINDLPTYGFNVSTNISVTV